MELLGKQRHSHPAVDEMRSSIVLPPIFYVYITEGKMIMRRLGKIGRFIGEITRSFRLRYGPIYGLLRVESG